MSDFAAQIVRASIDRGTSRVTLPVPNGPALFTISGQWDDDECGPNSTLVSLTCRTRKASSYTKHRLVRDTSFSLPADTIQLELEVLASCPGTALRVAVEPTEPPPRKHTYPTQRPSTDVRSTGQQCGEPRVTAEVAYDDGISAEQHANLSLGCKAVLPVKAGVRLFIAASGTWSPGSSVNVECRSRGSGVTLTLSPDNSIVVIPAGSVACFSPLCGPAEA